MSSRDPTRSAGLRRQGRGLVHRKVFELQKALRQALHEYDAVGLRERNDGLPGGFVLFSEAREHRLNRTDGLLQGVIAQIMTTPPDWLRELITRAVNKGIEQAGQELQVELLLDPAEVVGAHAYAAAVEIDGIAAETKRRIMRHAVHAVEGERSPDELMRNVRTVLEKITRLRLVLLVNTATVRAVNAGKLLTYEGNGVRQVGIDAEWVPAFHVHDRDTKAKPKAKSKRRKKIELPPVDEELVNVLTAGDDRVCDECDGIANDGPYDIDKARDLIPAHPNAVLEGSAIASYGAMHEMVRSVFRGPAVTFRAGPKLTTIGPNHPVLTRAGLIPARMLHEGLEVLYDIRTDRETARRSGRPHFEEMPLVEDVFEACRVTFGAMRVAATKSDLHGDAMFCEDEIDVVHPTGPLLPILNACGVEQLREGNFAGTDPDLALIPSYGSSFFGSHTVDLTAPRGVGRSDTLIAADVFRWVRVRSVEHVMFSGLAFDASTSSSLYCSDGFVVSNCRCAFIPFDDKRFAAIERDDDE